MMTHRAFMLLSIGVVVAMVAVVTVALVPRDDQTGDVDVVIVLGGGGMERLDLGTHIATRNGVPVVVSAQGIAQARSRGLECDVQVRCMHPDPVTTAGEAATMHALAEREGWERIAVATSSFHVNRARMLFRQCFGDRVIVTGAPATASGPTVLHRGVRELVGQVAAMTIRRAC